MKLTLLVLTFITSCHISSARAGELHNERLGAHGPVVVLMSGMSSSTEVWREVAEDLAVDHRVHIVSIPWIGGIPVPPQPIRTVALLTDALDHYLDKNNLTNITLVAHSASGVAALALGQRSSTRISTIVVVDSLPFMAGNFGAKSVDEGLRERIRNESLAIKSESKASFSRRMRTSVLNGIVHKETDTADRLAFAAGLSSQQIFASMYQSLMTTDLRDGIKHLSFPTYVIYADQTVNNAPQGFMRERYQLQYSSLAANHLIEVANSGHYLMVDYPAEVARHIRAVEASQTNHRFR